MYGKDYASPKTVAQLVVVRFVAESGLDEKFFLISFLQGFFRHGIMAFGTVSQLEFFDDVIPESAVTEISHTDAASFYMVMQDILEIVAGKLVDDEKAFALALNELFLVGQLPFLDLDTVFLGKVFQCLRVGHLFVLHDEVNYIAALAAGKAFAQSLGWRYVERRGLIVVERAQTYIVHSAFPQRDEV